MDFVYSIQDIINLSSLLVKYRKNMSSRVRFAFWMFIVAPLGAIAVQTISYGIQFIIFATVSAAVYMFTVIIEDINDASPKQVLDNVMDGINAFVKGAEHFDDITMMCLKYKGVK